MKYNKGITIVSLVITIIVIIILAGITIYYGLTNNTEKAVETKTVYEVHEIIDAVVNRALAHKINPDYYAYIGETNFSEPIEVGRDNQKTTYMPNDGWYLVNEESQFNQLGLDNLSNAYLINYENR